MDMCSKKMLEKNRKFIILAAIILIGVFLRAYNFHDWLLFGPDQVRDANIVKNAVDGKQPILLGAQAGNTKFHLGPVYYQMQYFSQKLFGISPEKLAYPDLLFSILTIPLLFLLFKKIFKENISFFLTFLYSISYFSIFSARFAVNSNSLSFFFILFLLGLIELMSKKDGHKTFWAALVGISMGIGIQLHALAFIAMPTIAIACCVYLIKIKNLSLKNFIVTVFFFLLVNWGQISYEISADHSNIANFFSGAGSQSEGLANDLGGNLLTSALCEARANTIQISAFNTGKYCSKEINFQKTFSDLKKGNTLLLGILISFLLTIGGYYLWIRRIKNCDYGGRKYLILLLLSNLIFLISFVPIVGQAEVHYFNFVFFVPYLMLGLLLQAIIEIKSDKLKKIIAGAIVLLVLISNFYYLFKDADKYMSAMASDEERCILGEIVPLANFISSHNQENKKVYLDGDRVSTHRYADALGFLAMQSGIEVLKLREDDNKIDQQIPFFYIKINNKPQKELKSISNRQVMDYKKNGNLTIYLLSNNKLPQTNE